ncbi:MAG: hypothetical protein V3T83_07635 [Acidobacteriota bacterium]
MLESLGWDSTFAKHFQNFQKPPHPDAFPARVISQQRGLYRIQGEQGEAAAAIRGRLRQNSIAREFADGLLGSGA